MSLRKKIIALFICIVLNSGLCCFALEASVQMIEKGSTLSMKDCLEIALNNSPLIKRARYNYGVSAKTYSISKAAYFPTIGIGTGYYVNTSSSSRGGGGRYGSYNRNTTNNYYSAEASLNQLIWNFGKTNANIRMNNFYRIAAIFDFDNIVLDTLFEVKNNYYNVLAAKAQVEINKANVQINERNYQRTKAYFDEGIRSKIDLVNAEVYLSDSKVALVNSEKIYQNALVQLNNSMYVAYTPDYEIESTENFKFSDNLAEVNLEDISKKEDYSAPPEEVDDAFLTSQVEKIEVLTDFKLNPFPYTFEESLEMAYENRPDLKAYDATLSAMKEALKYTKREYLPEISGNVGYGYRDSYNTNSFNVGVSLSTNVNILATKHEIDSAKLQVELAQNEIDLAKQNIYFEVQDAYINMMQLEKQIPLLAVKVRQTLENFELADGRYSVGIGDYIELQDAKVNYNNAQQSYVEAVFNYNVARANLEKAIALPQEVTATIGDEK